MESVKKLTNNVGGGGDNKDAAVTATSDRLFLLSYSEIVGTPRSAWSEWSWIGNEGTQYEYFKGKVTENNGANSIIAFDYMWWERTCNPYSSEYFLVVNGNGYPADDYLGTSSWVNCGFCF